MTSSNGSVLPRTECAFRVLPRPLLLHPDRFRIRGFPRSSLAARRSLDSVDHAPSVTRLATL